MSGIVRIGRDPACEIVLDSPLVSRFHASLEDGVLNDTRSANGTFVDGAPIKALPLKAGQRVTIGPYHLTFDGQELKFRGRGLKVSCRGLTFRPPGTDLKLLHGLNLDVEPGTFLALVGTSGAGKSTLMKMMAGLVEPSEGQVLFNGRARSSPEFRRSVGWVPQDEIVHARLTVSTALRFSAKLRLPSNTPESEIRRRIQYAAAAVTLSHRLDTPINRLSGGERKRVALAAEELGDPDVFFLDEPTSGLDPGLEKEIMLSLQSLARRGRTVILITHATANILLCDKVLFLAPGGHPVFYGPPAEALEHFQVDDFAEIYRLLTSPDWYPSEGKELGTATRVKLDEPLQKEETQPEAPAPAPPSGRTNLLAQLRLLLERDIILTAADRSYLALLVLQGPLIGAILGRLFPANTFDHIQKLDPQGRLPLMDGPTFLLMLVVTALFFGAINSCRELVQERAIYRREKLLGVRPWIYLTSKILLQGAKGAFSVIVLLGVVLGLLPLPWTAGEIVVAGVLLWIAYMGGAGLGLSLSALVGTGEQASTLVTVILIIQLVLSGAFIPPEAMTTPLAELSVLAVTRWTFAGLCFLSQINHRLFELHLSYLTADYYIPQDLLWGILWPLLGLHLAAPLVILYLRKERA